MAVISITAGMALDVYEWAFGESGRDDRADSIVDHFRRLAAAYRQCIHRKETCPWS